MKILVTGASGFIGSAIVGELVLKGHDVTGLVRKKANAAAVEEAGASVLVGDLLSPDSWTSAVKESDLVVSASQPIRYGEKVSFPEARRRSYYHGQMVGNLFLAAQESRVKGILVTYGVLGFGNKGEQWVSEYADLNPMGYEKSISGAFWHIDKTSRKTRVPLVNIFTGWTYGPGSWFDGMVRGLSDGTMKVVGTGDNYMSLIHIDDLAAAYGLMVEKMPLGERICIVDGDPVTQMDLAGYTADCLGCRRPKTIEADAYARLAGDLAAESMTCSVRVSGDRMKRTLGISLKYPSYREGVPEVIEAIGVSRGEKAAGF